MSWLKTLFSRTQTITSIPRRPIECRRELFAIDGETLDVLYDGELQFSAASPEEAERSITFACLRSLRAVDVWDRQYSDLVVEGIEGVDYRYVD